jgi:transcriptional regulator with XRE-family HTH domain
MVNARKIKGRLVELGLTQKDVAAKGCWDCALPTVSQKLNGVRPIYIDEANALAKLLKLTELEYYEFFFADEIA